MIQYKKSTKVKHLKGKVLYGDISRGEFCGFSAQRRIGFGGIQKKYGGNGAKDPGKLGDTDPIGDAGDALQRRNPL